MLTPRFYKHYKQERDVVLFRGDCLTLLRTIPDNSIDLTFSSPPYCMGKSYEKTDNVEDFISAHKKVLPEIVRVTKSGGSICWQVGYHVKSNALIPLDFHVLQLMLEYKSIKLRNRIIWTYGHGLHCERRFSGRHETILWFTKEDDYLINMDAVRVPQKYPGKRHYKGAKKGTPSGNPLGKNPSDVWDVPNVKANHKEKMDHPCQFPIALPQRAIRALCPPGGRVLDPFMGTGTTGAAAIIENRKFVGAEISRNYHQICFSRCRSAMEGTLSYRDDLEVYVPPPNTPLTINPFVLAQSEIKQYVQAS